MMPLQLSLPEINFESKYHVDPPTVSIIVPLYGKKEEQVENTLWSLENQIFYGSYEIILLNDGTDKDYYDRKFKYVRLRPAGSATRPLAHALRAGYEISNGEFIIVSHDDIISPPDVISSMLAYSYVYGRIVPVVYGLPRKATELVKWKENINKFKSLPGFLDEKHPSGYFNRDAKDVRHHIYFFGQTREWFDKMKLFDISGMNFEHYVHEIEKANFLPHHANIEVYHQWHERKEQYSARVRRIRND